MSAIEKHFRVVSAMQTNELDSERIFAALMTGARTAMQFIEAIGGKYAIHEGVEAMRSQLAFHSDSIVVAVVPDETAQ